MRAELLPTISARSASCAADRHRHEPYRLSLRGPAMSEARRFEVRVTADSHMAWLRTRLSIERTMMAWLRTAVSLIGFGFVIVQFFERLQQTPVRPDPPCCHPRRNTWGCL